MTYETDGGGWKGLLWEREDGSKLSFRDGIAKHWVSAWRRSRSPPPRARSACANTSPSVSARSRRAHRAHAPRRVRRRARSAARRRAGGGAGALGHRGSPRRRRLHERARARVRPGLARRAAAGTRRFDPGSYVVDLAQPQGRVARAILEPAPTLDPAFAKQQEERFARNARRGPAGARESYEFYDITAWSLPVAFGVEAWWTEDATAVAGAPLTLGDTSRSGPALGAASAGPATLLTPAPFTAAPVALVGPAAASYAADALPAGLAAGIGGGIVGGTRAQSAYVFGAERSGAPRLAWALLAAGVRLTVTTDSTEAGGRTWPRGTFVVRTSRNDTTVHATIDRLARESGVEVVAVSSAFTERSRLGVGSEEIVSLRRPRVAVVGDEGISQTAFGALWWSLDRRYGIDFTHLNWRALGGDLSRYNVLVIPDAYEVGQHVGGKEGVDRLKAWVRAGGTLITMGGASAWAAREDVALTSARRVGEDARPDTSSRDTPPDPRPAARPAAADTAAERRELLAVTSPGAVRDVPASLPGSHFDVLLDRTHWLTFGQESPRLTALVTGSAFLKLSKEGTNVVVFPATGTIHRAGFQWPDNTERLLRNSALVIEEPLGGGHVVLFANDPTFRGWWRAFDKLVLNAMLLGPAF
jgi:hypothetical protein